MRTASSSQTSPTQGRSLTTTPRSRRTFARALKFSDGTPVDSEHVKATFEYNTKNGGGTADCAGIKIQTPDPQNITITGPEPQAIIESKTCNPRIAPKLYLEASKFDIPVGSGPYVLDAEKTTTGSVYTFTENEDYWDAEVPVPDTGRQGHQEWHRGRLGAEDRAGRRDAGRPERRGGGRGIWPQEHRLAMGGIASPR
jgi:hypothetical protein